MNSGDWSYNLILKNVRDTQITVNIKNFPDSSLIFELFLIPHWFSNFAYNPCRFSPFLKMYILRKSNWNFVILKIKEFQDALNSTNKSYNVKNPSAFSKSIFQKIEFIKNLQCSDKMICDTCPMIVMKSTNYLWRKFVR